MPCYHPLKGWRSRKINENGKRAVVFDIREGYADMPVTVPCGKCIGCKLEKSRQWAIRCMHEASMYKDNCFITLTYNNDHLPADNSLNHEHFQKFFKRLRKKYGDRIRYYMCGEYGEKFSRPHYHACIFNFAFHDMYLFRVDSRGTRLYRSPELEKLWPYGFSTIGEVTFESAAYVARYVTKKLTGSKPFTIKINNEKITYSNSEEHYQVIDYTTGEVTYRTREYAQMSRRPGIGKPWLLKYATDVYPQDHVIMRGRKMIPPRYYDDFLEKENFELYQQIKRRRKQNSKEITARRLEDMEKVKISKTKTLYRKYENEIQSI